MTSGTFHWKRSGAVSILVPDFFVPLGLAGGFTARADDDGRELDLDLRGPKPPAQIIENRETVLSAMGIPLQNLVVAEQVHGAEVAIVSERDAGRGARDGDDAISGADALATASTSVALAGLSADCPIVLIADEKRSAAAAVHSGWRGTAAGVAARAVGALSDLSAPPESLFAAIGPSIGPCCYRVGREVREAFPPALAAAEGVFGEREGSLYLDLQQAIRRQLLDCGFVPDRISAAPHCTSCESGLFYSYRREGAAAGRCAGVIAIRR